MAKRNPFDGKLARLYSSYSRYRAGKLVLPMQGDRPAPVLEQFVHKLFRSRIRCREYSCTGAKSAFQRGTYGFGLYPAMATPEATAGLSRDLFAFVQEQTRMAGDFTTYVACFSSPLQTDQVEFEQLLWRELQRLHDVDSLFHAWDPSVSSDPQDPRFSFSFAQQAFFIVGMHPGSSRLARQFILPVLVFNAHYQFENLRQAGKYQSFQRVIRKRELALQGSINPNLADYGARSEARQYSGRAVPDDWICPLVVRDRAASQMERVSS